MKRILRSAGLVAGALPALALAQESRVDVYGQVRLTANSVKTGTQPDAKELRDNASRLGFRGREDLGGGLSAMFGLEMGFGADTGSFADAAIPYRHSYVALKSPWGAVALGRLDSANPTGSPLYSQVTAITSFAPNDAGATAIGTSMLNARNRTSNSVGYASPKIGSFDLRVRGYLRGAGTAAEPESAARSLDIGVNHAEGPLTAGVGWARDQRAGGLAANEFSSKWQAGVLYDFGSVDAYVLGGRDRYNATAATRADVDFAIAGISTSSGPHKLVFNLLRRDVQASPTGVRRRHQVGYQHALSRRTELQAFYDRDGVDSSRPGVAVRALGAGIRHDF